MLIWQFIAWLIRRFVPDHVCCMVEHEQDEDFDCWELEMTQWRNR